MLVPGSSPRLRGTRRLRLRRDLRGRIIPAPAGNTKLAVLSGIGSSDHPRACGEHLVWSAGPIQSQGSSPRLRGTPIEAMKPHRQGRIIPAPAGNTRPTRPFFRPSPDHPRACGEHRFHVAGKLPEFGSSPRLRGTLSSCLETECKVRIIPAPAGNTRPCARACRSATDHPRACGEHTTDVVWPVVPTGSSPRLRGTPG